MSESIGLVIGENVNKSKIPSFENNRKMYYSWLNQENINYFFEKSVSVYPKINFKKLWCGGDFWHKEIRFNIFKKSFTILKWKTKVE